MSKPSKGSKGGAGGAEAILVISVAVTGRTPASGWIMSLGCTAITPLRQIIDTFCVNMLPLPGLAAVPPADVAKYWHSKRDVLELLTKQPVVSAAVGMTQLQGFCKKLGKCTLVASPMMSVYLWLAHYWATLMPNAPMPWGFSGTCARSFASGVLGIPMKSLSSDPEFVASFSGYDATGYPLTDSIGIASMFTHMQMLSMKQTPPPLTWSAKLVAIPPQLPRMVSRLLEVSDALELPFGEYPSITDPTFDEQCLSTFDGAAPGVEWVATEKVHGSNMLVLCDGKSVLRCAKRTGLLKLADNEAFFYFAHVISPLEGLLQRLATMVMASRPDVTLVSVAGELAGGEYAHPEVAVDLRGTRVQNGVQYAPFNFFYAFDIAVQRKHDGEKVVVGDDDGTKAEVWEYLPYDESAALFTAVGLLHAQPLCRGTLADVIMFSEEFQSTIPGLLGLPQIGNNFAEGLVLRPAASEITTPESDGRRRVMIKRKHPDFKEFAKVAAPRDAASMLTSMICANRLAAVSSKMTQDELRDSGVVASLLVRDAVADLKKLMPCDEVTAEMTAAVTAHALAFITSPEGLSILANRM